MCIFASAFIFVVGFISEPERKTRSCNHNYSFVFGHWLGLHSFTCYLSIFLDLTSPFCEIYKLLRIKLRNIFCEKCYKSTSKSKTCLIPTHITHFLKSNKSNITIPKKPNWKMKAERKLKLKTGWLVGLLPPFDGICKQ